MGNNQAKYFPKSKRKVILLGPEGSGKTTLFKLMVGAPMEEVTSLYIPTDRFQNQNVKLLKKGAIQFDLWDIQGKLPHLWSNSYSGGV
jgi:GTPase SAR1 family protein